MTVEIGALNGDNERQAPGTRQREEMVLSLLQ
jgi:hypothetical protein